MNDYNMNVENNLNNIIELKMIDDNNEYYDMMEWDANDDSQDSVF